MDFVRSLGDRISSLTESATRRENLATTVVVGTLVTASTAILARRWWTKPRDGALSEYQAPFAEPVVVKTRSGEEVTVRRVAATSAATAKAGATLGSALKKDPLVVACAKKGMTEADVEASASWLYRTLIRSAVPSSQKAIVLQADTAKKEAVGVAIWFPPGVRFDENEFFWQGGWQYILWYSGWDRRLRFPGIADMIVKRRQRLTKNLYGENYYYLLVAGVASDEQKHEYGSALLRPVLAEADKRRVPCYLETSNPDAIRFFEDLEFQAVEVVSDLFDGTMTILIRPPLDADGTRPILSSRVLAGIPAATASPSAASAASAASASATTGAPKSP